MRTITKSQVKRTEKLFAEIAGDKVFVTTHESPTRFEVRTSQLGHVRLAREYINCKTSSTRDSVFTLLMPNFTGFAS